MRSVFATFLSITLLFTLLFSFVSCECLDTWLDVKENNKPAENDENLYTDMHVYRFFSGYEEALEFYNLLLAHGKELRFHSVNFNYEDEDVFSGYIFFGTMTPESFKNSKGKELYELDYIHFDLAGGLYLKSDFNHELHQEDDYYLYNYFIQIIPYSHYSDTPLPEEIDTTKLVFENYSTKSDVTDIYHINSCYVRYNNEIILHIYSHMYIEDAFLEKIRNTLVVFRGDKSFYLSDYI